MTRTLFTAAAILLFASPALAGHGGKLPFDGNIAKQQEIAKTKGLAAVYYVTAEW